MWVKALDLLMDQLKITGLDFQDISAISGAGQVCLKNEILSYLNGLLFSYLDFSNMEVFIGESELRRF
jgi:hypothetical protein